MKNFRRLCFAIVLTLAFTVPALAGDGHTPGAPDPGDAHTPGAPSPGDQHTPGYAITGIEQTPGFMAPGDIDMPTLNAILSLVSITL